MMNKLISTLLALNLSMTGVASNVGSDKEVEQVKTSEVVEVEKQYEQPKNTPIDNEQLYKAVAKNKKMLEALELERQQLLKEGCSLIEIELVEVYEDEVYFYDHSAEYEPRIYVSREMFEHWGVDDMEVGDKVFGIFDGEFDWELLGFRKFSDTLDSERQALLEGEHKIIEVELVDIEEHEVYFYDHSAEYEPRIYVDLETFAHWEVDGMKVGDTINAIFDGEGWELLGFEKYFLESIDSI